MPKAVSFTDTLTENPAERIAPVEPKNLTCIVCLTEIPESVAASSEADEYAQHFCGIDCYAKWHNAE